MSALVRVSRPSPVAGCRFGGSGTAFTNAECEPWLAVNPSNPNHLIGVWQQDRWSNGFARAIVAGFSFDGGATWNETPLPFSLCTTSRFNFGRTVDGWVSIGPDGTAYSCAFSVNRITNSTAILAATSSNGGRTWQNAQIIISNRGKTFINNKPSITADPTRPGVAYVVWDRLQFGSSGSLVTGPTLFSKTTNGGRTWSKPKIIFAPGSGNSTIGNEIIVDPRNGKLYNFFNWQVRSGVNRGRNISVQRSNDGGATWSTATIIAKQMSVPLRTPNTGTLIRAGNVLPQAAVGPRGMLYAVWADSRFSGGRFVQIAISHSSDGGVTWSKPIRVSPPTGKAAFTPNVAVNSRGVVGVTYYDFRSATTQTGTTPTDYWIRFSANGAESFGVEKHIAGPFDILTAPQTNGGRFLGDYQGLVAIGRTFHPFFARANSGVISNRTDIFTTSIVP
ncbi:sialidase family protein [Paenibacillus thermotolerans]|uniref:sialidase family protein n=1 Tax=Paenibacillus thermotolerans TaxID=3027807 RepID=UPI002367D41B|nr:MULTISPECIES: sialidase family protein [unclassified Paenibacillus]